MSMERCTRSWPSRVLWGSSVALLCAVDGGAQEWTRFRGPDGTGLSDAEGIPSSWRQDEVLWKVRLPGSGNSQPVVWGEKVFVTCAAADEHEGTVERTVACLHASTGRTLWAKSYRLSALELNPRNLHAASTPAVDAERAYVAFGSKEAQLLLALDHAGKEAWRHDLGPFSGEHGTGGSPVVHGDLVIFANEHDGPSHVVALDRRTGREVWKTKRRTSRTAYGTPRVYREADGRSCLLLLSQAHGLASLDVSTGEPIWEAPVFDKRTVSSPLFANGLAVGTCGSGGGGNYVAVVRAGGKGNVAETHRAYEIRQSAPYVPTPVILDDLLFLWSERGIVCCVELATGDVVWRERVPGSFYGSPVCISRRLFCMSEEGEAVVLAAARTFREIARNPLGEGSRSTPAVAGGVLYLRTYSHLIAVGARRPDGG